MISLSQLLSAGNCYKCFAIISTHMVNENYGLLLYYTEVEVSEVDKGLPNTQGFIVSDETDI